MPTPPVGNDVPCPEPPRVSIVNRQEYLTPIAAYPGKLVSQYSDSLLDGRANPINLLSLDGKAKSRISPLP